LGRHKAYWVLEIAIHQACERGAVSRGEHTRGILYLFY
jgi:hypothetical protein